METNTRITIKKAINDNPSLASQLKRNSKTLSAAIQTFALITKLEPVFIEQNINRIQNWID